MKAIIEELYLEYKTKLERLQELAYTYHLSGDKQTEMEVIKKAAGCKLMMDAYKKQLEGL